MNTETKTKREVTPKLVCNITGSSRVTNQKYLSAKAQKKNTDVETFLQYYVSKDTLRQLKAGRSVTDIRSDYPDAPSTDMSAEWLAKCLNLNGKSGPSGPHRPSPISAPQSKQLSPEVEKLVQAVQEREVALQ